MELGLVVLDGGAVDGVVAVVGKVLSRTILLSGLLERRQGYRPLLSMKSSVHAGLHIREGGGRLLP